MRKLSPILPLLLGQQLLGIPQKYRCTLRIDRDRFEVGTQNLRRNLTDILFALRLLLHRLRQDALDDLGQCPRLDVLLFPKKVLPRDDLALLHSLGVGHTPDREGWQLSDQFFLYLFALGLFGRRSSLR